MTCRSANTALPYQNTTQRLAYYLLLLIAY